MKVIPRKALLVIKNIDILLENIIYKNLTSTKMNLFKDQQ